MTGQKPVLKSVCPDGDSTDLLHWIVSKNLIETYKLVCKRPHSTKFHPHEAPLRVIVLRQTDMIQILFFGPWEDKKREDSHKSRVRILMITTFSLCISVYEKEKIDKYRHRLSSRKLQQQKQKTENQRNQDAHRRKPKINKERNKITQ
ncbi:hypothetical protein AVEN_256413-1 [Araneus ventricosus]|uniref:Uncharacterized protein n=1 Tax=Araneus ventricosus TaxID=182803 RepID=A0A4Y2QT65_ARAVE|nr:hypothetical protein AVEN_256413-1 [Araneus ventricosus]